LILLTLKVAIFIARSRKRRIRAATFTGAGLLLDLLNVRVLAWDFGAW